MTDELHNMGRLAMREEGIMWVAYWALPDTMKEAIPLGAILLRFVRGHEERKRIFMDLMKEAVGDLIEEKTGRRPSWTGAQDAPEHERSGHA